MTFPRKRGRLLESDDDDDEEDLIDSRRTRKKSIPSYAESDSDYPRSDNPNTLQNSDDTQSENDSHSFPVRLRIGVEAARSLSLQMQNEDAPDNSDLDVPASQKSRKSITNEMASRQPSRRRHNTMNDDEEEEYKDDANTELDEEEDEEDSIDEEDADDGHNFIASDSDDEKPRRRRGRPSGSSGKHQLKKPSLRRRNHNLHSSDVDGDFRVPSLHNELAELKSDSPPPRRKHLRERKDINYQILPPPPLDEPLDLAAPAAAPRRKAAGPIRQLFRTVGPFGGSDIVSIFGQNNHAGLKAAGGVTDSDSSDDDSPAKPASNTVTAPLIKGKNNLADSDPLGIDTDIDFSVVGGLDSYIDQLKEMVSLPLKYPEVYQRFGVTPPRGVLFHGPPGTGKTLMARALAASCSSEGKKVTFFMRKGADCLSKWVGEAERQLRLLFEEAKNQQPSIIFFDEIDGLAPVRSSKQEQIHASIVSTLLALMDGMDNRGQVIVIGATNRPDSVDSALRRPGRFDREFYFPLPDLEARKKIISIHTRKWDPPLDPSFIEHISRVTKGYGGADLRALCTEAALAAIQRRYPQIYQSKDKLLIDPSSIHVSARDFMKSVEKIVPSSARSISSNASPLPTHIEPLLTSILDELKTKVDTYIPRKKKITSLEEAMLEDFDDADGGFARIEATREFQTSRVFRPRLLVYGLPGMGQQYLGAAILHHLEGYHIQSFDLGTLLSDSTRTPEAMIIQLLVEIKRHTPSVIFIPNLDTWFGTISPTAKSTFLSFLRDLKPTDSILVLALMETNDIAMNPQASSLFGYSGENIYQIPSTPKSARKKFFELLIKYIKSKPTDFLDLENRPKRKLEELPIAPIAPEKDLTEAELKKRKRRDMQTKNKLKIKLSAIMDPIKNRYKKFKKPIIDSIFLYHLFQPMVPAIPQAYERAENDMILEVATGKKYFNIDLDVIEERLWNGYYSEPKQFLSDIKMIHQDSLTSCDRERVVKSSEMLTNVQVYIDEISLDTQFLADCQGLRKREKEEQELLLKSLPKSEEHMPIDLTQVTSEPASSIDEVNVVHSNGHSTTNGGLNGHVESVTEIDVVMVDHSDEGEIHAVDPIINPTIESNSESLVSVLESVPVSNSQFLVPDPEPVPLSKTEVTMELNNDPIPARSPTPEPEPDLIISDEMVTKFSKKLISATKGLSIERIEQVNSTLIDLLWYRRQDWDRNSIIVDLEAKLIQVTDGIKSSQESQMQMTTNEFYA